MKCKLCDKKANGEYCRFHKRAYDNILDKYALWKSTMKISWIEYLREVIKNKYSGSWVKDVAEDLLQKRVR